MRGPLLRARGEVCNGGAEEGLKRSWILKS